MNLVVGRQSLEAICLSRRPLGNGVAPKAEAVRAVEALRGHNPPSRQTDDPESPICVGTITVAGPVEGDAIRLEVRVGPCQCVREEWIVVDGRLYGLARLAIGHAAGDPEAPFQRDVELHRFEARAGRGVQELVRSTAGRAADRCQDMCVPFGQADQSVAALIVGLAGDQSVECSLSSRRVCSALTIAPGIGSFVSASRTTPSIGCPGSTHDRAVGAVVAAVEERRPIRGRVLEPIHLSSDDLDAPKCDRWSANVDERQPVATQARQTEPAVTVGRRGVGHRWLTPWELALDREVVGLRWLLSAGRLDRLLQPAIDGLRALGALDHVDPNARLFDRPPLEIDDPPRDRHVVAYQP